MSDHSPIKGIMRTLVFMVAVMGHATAAVAREGAFQPATTYSAVISAADIAIGDLNGDGRLDVAATAASGMAGFAVLLGNGDGTFQKGQMFTIGNVPYGAAIGDLNDDARPDVVTVNFGGGT